MEKIRVRFAPSPTGPLHIGGVRTALYNYLFARKHNGTFILRIEDTDQVRYVSGAEDYIIESLRWFGLIPDEGPKFGGHYGPYRQSERKDIYRQYAEKLLEKGYAYYAFDTPEELDAMREMNPTFKYDNQSRLTLKNSLTLTQAQISQFIAEDKHVAVRLKMPIGEKISFNDEIRGHVSFDTNELDDKVILKGDGMPTYHLANIVDDHLMEISHVIRGEEWLSSTAHHVYMYKCMGWTPPSFSHLPLILKPSGQGKLSKRDGAKYGFPVFPISWDSDIEGDNFIGFKEDGYLPEAILNFLVLLGWSPGNDKELFTLQEMCEAFDLDKIVKSGARFDIDKARWFNQHYIIQSDNLRLAYLIQNTAIASGYHVSIEYLSEVCRLMKERVHKTDEIITNARFFFVAPQAYDDATISKKYKASCKPHLQALAELMQGDSGLPSDALIKGYITDRGLKLGDYMPLLRIAISGSMQGPDLMESITLIGHQECSKRLLTAIMYFDQIMSE